MPFMVAYLFFDCFVGVCSGIIRGVGMQKFGAIVCCVSLYLIGGPLALCLLLLTDLVVNGFWLGMAIGVFLEMFVYTIQCCRIDWKKMCIDAHKRTAIKFVGHRKDNKAGLREDNELEISLAEPEEVHSDLLGTGQDEKKSCTPKTFITPITMILIVVSLLLVALCCRFLFDWPMIFPNYCLLKNETLIPLIDRSDANNYGCTVLIP
ncbi:unnamed protein product [Rodentolepis nana]|uniref:Multidrug resistance protein, MATE family n=1 Tax=Rodentolepis nana TaxID=102285 RepID=A0A0R3TDN9_RODNA|nr:unnamed protein product [Rodentolepis nana]